jgi:hypothetical protein
MVVATTAQEKAITFSTDAKLLARSRIQLMRLTKRLHAAAPVLRAGGQTSANPRLASIR